MERLGEKWEGLDRRLQIMYYITLFIYIGNHVPQEVVRCCCVYSLQRLWKYFEQYQQFVDDITAEQLQQQLEVRAPTDILTVIPHIEPLINVLACTDCDYGKW